MSIQPVRASKNDRKPRLYCSLERFNVQQIGAFASLLFVAADAVALSGDWMSGFLIGAHYGAPTGVTAT
jgi:hypothetical protein